MPYWNDGRVHDAAVSGRIVLTKKRRMEACSNTMVITHDSLSDQIRQLDAFINLEQYATPFSRCNVCNSVLNKLSREEVKGLVPEYVYTAQEDFAKCPSCGRIYWKGTHFEHACRLIDSLMHAGCR
jgi:hypothetical protein